MKKYLDYKNYAITLKKLNPTAIFINSTEENVEFFKGTDFLSSYECVKELSFTPYIYNECSATCKFCSENLIRNGKAMICKDITTNYEEKFKSILESLRESNIFLSLSGKEPTESIDFLRKILKVTKEYEESKGIITQKVMYSNLSGFVNNMTELKNILMNYNVTRIESSRHHYDENINQNIMNFKNSSIMYNSTYENTIKELLSIIPIKLVAVIQKGGIENVELVNNYINWAKTIGIKEIVFRELALFNEEVEKNATAFYIENNRVELMELLNSLSEDFKINSIKCGYYYVSFMYQYDDIMISFEMSDYEEMIKKHKSNKIYKLIYYPNGKLCLDWNMKGEIF